jgi:hypothetical protein
MTRIVSLLAVSLVAALAAGPAAAHERSSGFSAPPSSVFPQPRDPWRSWGVRSELPRRVGPPRTHDDGVIASPSAPRAVWVPQQWVWDGATHAWVWWPGHWVR